MQQFEIREHSLDELIFAVEESVKGQPYSEWKIGVSNGQLDDEGCISTIVLNPNNNPAVLAAYNHFSRLGMAAKQPVPSETKYLYLFKDTWAKNIEVNF